MSSFVDIDFRGVPEDTVVTLSVHQSVARLAAARIDVQCARVVVEPLGRRRTRVSATLCLADGGVHATRAEHADAAVGVIDAFGALRRRAAAHAPARAPRSRARLRG